MQLGYIQDRRVTLTGRRCLGSVTPIYVFWVDLQQQDSLDMYNDGVHIIFHHSNTIAGFAHPCNGWGEVDTSGRYVGRYT